MRILFQGDSITDAGRDRRNFRDLGHGYAHFAAEALRQAFPEKEFDFINLGISGNRSGQLFDRIYHDGIALCPDIVSVMIGINDVCQRYNASRVLTTDAQFALNLRTTLSLLREQTKAKILVLSPYLLYTEGKPECEDIRRVIAMVEDLAAEFADAYVPMQKIFDEAIKENPMPKYFSADGVHPTEPGARLIAEAYVSAVKPLISTV